MPVAGTVDGAKAQKRALNEPDHQKNRNRTHRWNSRQEDVLVHHQRLRPRNGNLRIDR